jgi:hypothetical protein
MATFSFYIDQKCSVWQRGMFDIQAETYEQAKELAKNQKFDIDEISWETLWETLTDIEFDDNNGQPTMEIYSNDNAGELVITNERL